MARKVAEAPTPMSAEQKAELTKTGTVSFMEKLATTEPVLPTVPEFQTHPSEKTTLFNTIEHGAEFAGEISRYGLALAEQEGHKLALRGAELLVAIVAHEANPDGEAHRALHHVLGAWEEEQKFQANRKVYEKFHIGRRPQRPHHFLKHLPEELAEAVGFRWIEDHFGNFIHPKISSSQKVNDVVEGVIDGGIVLAGNIALERLIRSAQEYIVIAAAEKLPDDVRPYVERSVEYSLDLYDNARVQAATRGKRK